MNTNTSKSVIVNKFGGYDVLQVGDFELPPLDGKIEVKVEYGGLNFADLYTRQGLMLDRKLPFVLGMECSGIVTAIGVDKSEFQVGQKVLCYDYKGGMYRETVRVDPKHCFPVPDHVNSETAASIFVNYLTAYFAVYELGNLRKNQRVLIMSCAGGVGVAATQLAKLLEGVEIYGTGSDFKDANAKANGVDVFITHENFKEEIKKHQFDLILATNSGPILEFYQTLLKPLGRLVILGANNIIQNENKLSMMTLLKLWWTTKNISPESLVMYNRVVAGLHLGTLMENNLGKIRETLNHIFELLKKGKIKPVVDSIWRFNEIVQATKVLAERKNIGKVLLKFGDENQK